MAVMIQVKNIADMGAYVSLLEYNNIKGMILFSELFHRLPLGLQSQILCYNPYPPRKILLWVERESSAASGGDGRAMSEVDDSGGDDMVSGVHRHEFRFLRVFFDAEVRSWRTSRIQR
ncbi:hypothetical protein K1719_004539 [Acacia pycnantha]|nr:hypothetical protein K1719_004539 [Acacia pycnantha]